jgi:hypothetical protein
MPNGTRHIKNTGEEEAGVREGDGRDEDDDGGDDGDGDDEDELASTASDPPEQSLTWPECCSGCVHLTLRNAPGLVAFAILVIWVWAGAANRLGWGQTYETTHYGNYEGGR